MLGSQSDSSLISMIQCLQEDIGEYYIVVISKYLFNAIWQNNQYFSPKYKCNENDLEQWYHQQSNRPDPLTTSRVNRKTLF